MTTEGADGAIMTPTLMDPVADQATLEPPETPPSPSTRFRAPALSSWTPMFQNRERRWWTAALAATVLISAFGIGVLYVDDSNQQAAVRNLQTQNESLTGRNEILIDQLKTTQTNLTATLGELATTKAELAHPTLVIWNVPEQIKGSSWYLAGGIPDTFTYHLEATSTGPMSVSILTFEDWAAANQCVDPGGGTVNYCMHHSGTVRSWLNQTSVNFDFHESEGCADYLAVFTSAGNVTVTPKVSVTYNPARSATGACA